MPGAGAMQPQRGHGAGCCQTAGELPCVFCLPAHPRPAPSPAACRPSCVAGWAISARTRRRSRRPRATSAARRTCVTCRSTSDRPGTALLVLEGEGFVCAHEGSPSLLAARSEAAAGDLLWGAITSGPPGAKVACDFVTPPTSGRSGPAWRPGWRSPRADRFSYADGSARWRPTCPTVRTSDAIAEVATCHHAWQLQWLGAKLGFD